MRGVIPASITPGSEISITLLTSSRFISHPTSSEAPGPYFSGVASIVKMVSLPDPPLPFAAMLLLSPTGFPTPRSVFRGQYTDTQNPRQPTPAFDDSHTPVCSLRRRIDRDTIARNNAIARGKGL